MNRKNKKVLPTADLPLHKTQLVETPHCTALIVSFFFFFGFPL